MKQAKRIFALGGYDSLGMRELAKQSDIGLSSIYHFFKDKDVLLKSIFDQTNRDLGVKRAELPKRNNALEALQDRVRFQFENIEDVVFVLKYYLHYRPNFMRLDSGYLPTKAYLHIDEVVRLGLETGEYKTLDAETDAKVMAHAINGFLLEYYPKPPTGNELEKLVRLIADFLHKSMTNERSVHEVAK